MFKLTIVNGPAKGQTFKLEKNEMVAGRVPDADISLQSGRISKKHCAFSMSGENVTVRDLGSSNGTFVNGVLVKEKKLNSGDRVSVGEYVLEITKIAAKFEQTAQGFGNHSNVIPLKGMPVGVPGGMTGAITGMTQGTSAGIPAQAQPTDFRGKVMFLFEKHVLNFLYNLNEKQEWRSLIGMMFAVMIAGCAVLSVYPVLERTADKLETEGKERALLLSRQIVDRNSQFLYEKLDSKVDVTFAEREKGVLSATILDLDGRILAPARKLNQYMTEANEATFSTKAREYFNKKEKAEEYSRVYDGAVLVATPLRVFNQAQGKNTTVALGIVSYDRSQLLMDSGSVMLAYIQAIILAGIIGILVYFSTYKLTLRPLMNLNEEIDQILKGNGSSVSKKYRMEEIDPLVDIVNTALQKATSGAHAGAGAVMMGDQVSADEVVGMFKSLFSNISGAGLLIVSSEKKVVFLNSFMEEITGIRCAVAAGDELANVVRDAAFESFVTDITSRAAPLSEPITEDFDFSGNDYKICCSAVGQPGVTKYYVITAGKV